MENAFLVSLSHQMAAHRSMEVIANNLANLSTPAYKRESVQFEEFTVKVQPAQGKPAPQYVSFVLDRGVVRDLAEGRFVTTDAPLDLAIGGAGYFVVSTPGGERFTRNGHFMLDAAGRLVTADGHPVMGEGGEITIKPEDGEPRIAPDGTVSGAQGQIGKIRLASVGNERALKKEGSSLYVADDPVLPAAATIHQGVIETSNVEAVVELTRMIDVMRAYQASANLTDTSEELLRQAIQKLGQIQPG